MIKSPTLFKLCIKQMRGYNQRKVRAEAWQTMALPGSRPLQVDKNLNKINQECRLDLNIRYCDCIENMSKARYWKSKMPMWHLSASPKKCKFPSMDHLSI